VYLALKYLIEEEEEQARRRESYSPHLNQSIYNVSELSIMGLLFMISPTYSGVGLARQALAIERLSPVFSKRKRLTD
jgi:hypothetical protein